jgi:sugar-specific transcriptional regulator TrmB
MLNNKNNLLIRLRQLGLNADEAKIYLALLEKPLTHLEVARVTGVNRTTVYRVADVLEARSLITRNQRDDGKFLTANDPSNLEVMIATAEDKVKHQHQVFQNTLPALAEMFQNKEAPSDTHFSISTYDGSAGLKQMLWNELKTQGEILVWSNESIDRVAGRRWAEKFRAELIAREIPQRGLENFDDIHVLDHTEVENYHEIYKPRFLPRDLIDIKQEMTIHDDTVSIYNWARDGESSKVGLEIHNKQFANFQRAVFETYWKIAE